MLPFEYMYDIHDGAKQFYLEKGYIKYNDKEDNEKIKNNDTMLNANEFCSVKEDIHQNCGYKQLI